MSTILAIETSTETASVALLTSDGCLSRQSNGAQTHSQTVLPLIQALLAEAGISISACDAIAFGSGPGSFTGVRTACGVAQGLAFGADLPVAPVITLDALAQACMETHAGAANSIVAMLDARMGEVYWAQYGLDAEYVSDRIIVEPSLAMPAGIDVSGKFLLCGNATSAYPDALAPLVQRAFTTMPTLPHAEHIAALGKRMLQRGECVSAALAQPLYLRNKVAQTTAERRAGATV